MNLRHTTISHNESTYPATSHHIWHHPTAGHFLEGHIPNPVSSLSNRHIQVLRAGFELPIHRLAEALITGNSYAPTGITIKQPKYNRHPTTSPLAITWSKPELQTASSWISPEQYNGANLCILRPSPSRRYTGTTNLLLVKDTTTQTQAPQQKQRQEAPIGSSHSLASTTRACHPEVTNAPPFCPWNCIHTVKPLHYHFQINAGVPRRNLVPTIRSTCGQITPVEFLSNSFSATQVRPGPGKLRPS